MLLPLAVVAQIAVAVPADTPMVERYRVNAVDVSEWYHRRFTIHRWLSYATIPLFAGQYAAGREIWDKGRAAPRWARTGHRVGATTLAGVFAVNTVTGVWNLWDSRAVPEQRKVRYLHAASMLVADAGFTWAGARLSEQAERDPAKRRLHRQVALSSLALATASGVMMKVFNK